MADFFYYLYFFFFQCLRILASGFRSEAVYNFFCVCMLGTPLQSKGVKLPELCKSNRQIH